MIAQARRRAAEDGVDERCRFTVGELAHLRLEERFDLVLGVTVLQHILDPAECRAALSAMAAHLAPGGRVILLEAAPTAAENGCDSTVFTARHRDVYLKMISSCGLEVRALTGVDPAPFRSQLLPYVRNVPRAAGLSLMALATALSLPINLLIARRAARRSWHAVFVLEKIIRGA
jgi:SAM-dependent methyltransferase